MSTAFPDGSKASTPPSTRSTVATASSRAPLLDGRLDGDDDLERDESPRAGRRGGAPTPAQVFSPTWWW